MVKPVDAQQVKYAIHRSQINNVLLDSGAAQVQQLNLSIYQVESP
jgi:hypothetical protein